MSHINYQDFAENSLMARMRNKIKTEIAVEQCGFVEDKETNMAIYMCAMNFD